MEIKIKKFALKKLGRHHHGTAGKFTFSLLSAEWEVIPVGYEEGKFHVVMRAIHSLFTFYKERKKPAPNGASFL